MINGVPQSWAEVEELAVQEKEWESRVLHPWEAFVRACVLFLSEGPNSTDGLDAVIMYAQIPVKATVLRKMDLMQKCSLLLKGQPFKVLAGFAVLAGEDYPKELFVQALSQKSGREVDSQELVDAVAKAATWNRWPVVARVPNGEQEAPLPTPLSTSSTFVNEHGNAQGNEETGANGDESSNVQGGTSGTAIGDKDVNERGNGCGNDEAIAVGDEQGDAQGTETTTATGNGLGNEETTVSGNERGNGRGNEEVSAEGDERGDAQGTETTTATGNGLGNEETIVSGNERGNRRGNEEASAEGDERGDAQGTETTTATGNGLGNEETIVSGNERGNGRGSEGTIAKGDERADAQGTDTTNAMGDEGGDVFANEETAVMGDERNLQGSLQPEKRGGGGTPRNHNVTVGVRREKRKQSGAHESGNIPTPPPTGAGFTPAVTVLPPSPETARRVTAALHTSNSEEAQFFATDPEYPRRFLACYQQAVVASIQSAAVRGLQTPNWKNTAKQRWFLANEYYALLDDISGRTGYDRSVVCTMMIVTGLHLVAATIPAIGTGLGLAAGSDPTHSGIPKIVDTSILTPELKAILLGQYSQEIGRTALPQGQRNQESWRNYGKADFSRMPQSLFDALQTIKNEMGLDYSAIANLCLTAAAWTFLHKINPFGPLPLESH